MKKTIVTKTGKVEIVLTPEQEAERQAKIDAGRIESLQSELDSLQSKFAAKGLIWMIKREIVAGRLTKAELPPAMIAAYDRMEEIETELGG